MVEQSYVEEPRGECAEDSAIIARDRSAFVIFTGLEHVDELFWIHGAIQIRSVEENCSCGFENCSLSAM